MDLETLTMQLIVKSGEAQSKAMKAIDSAKNGNAINARETLKEAEDLLTQAHKFQTEIIQEEANGNIKSTSILMAHAQDHLMNAITVNCLANEFVDLYEKIDAKFGKEF